MIFFLQNTYNYRFTVNLKYLKLSVNQSDV